MSEKILVINFGSTSTKLAVFDGDRPEFTESLTHSRDELAAYGNVAGQLDMRKKLVEVFLMKNGVEVRKLTAIVGRTGPFMDMWGAYKMNDLLYGRIMDRTNLSHPAALSCVVGWLIGKSAGVPAYMYVFNRDDMAPQTKLTGYPEITRPAGGHPESWNAVAIKTAIKLGKPQKDLTMIIAHLGGGITMGLCQKGKFVDSVGDCELHFSPERSGGAPTRSLLDLYCSGKYTRGEMNSLFMGRGGMYAHLGTVDGRDVEARIVTGDEKAKLVYEAMTLQISKSIAMLAATACGAVDRIVITGGLANSKMIVRMIRERVSFIAELEVFPGEYEMEAFALSLLKVLRGEEDGMEYTQALDAIVINLDDKKN